MPRNVTNTVCSVSCDNHLTSCARFWGVQPKARSPDDSWHSRKSPRPRRKQNRQDVTRLGDQVQPIKSKPAQTEVVAAPVVLKEPKGARKRFVRGVRASTVRL